MSEGTTTTALETIQRIARDELGLETLDERKRDSHDFKEHAVWSIRQALLDAYAAGQASHEDLADVAHGLRGMANAYPEDVFPPLTDEDRKHPGTIMRASAGMGRHLRDRLLALADRLDPPKGMI